MFLGLTPDQQGFLIKLGFALGTVFATYTIYWLVEHEHLLYKYTHILNL